MVSLAKFSAWYSCCRIIARYNRQHKGLDYGLLLAGYNSAMDQLALIRRAVKLRERRRAAFDDADAELQRLIREGFEQGIAGEKLAEAAGLSVPRVYQIRDGRR